MQCRFNLRLNINIGYLTDEFNLSLVQPAVSGWISDRLLMCRFLHISWCMSVCVCEARGWWSKCRHILRVRAADGCIVTQLSAASRPTEFLCISAEHSRYIQHIVAMFKWSSYCTVIKFVECKPTRSFQWQETGKSELRNIYQNDQLIMSVYFSVCGTVCVYR